MAMALLLRNATKFNGAGLVKAVRLTPLKSYTTILGAERQAMVKPLALVKQVAPLGRQIATSAPKLAAAGANHTAMWTAERGISAGLLAIMPLAFMFPSRFLDAVMAISVIIHTHWGIEAMITDYLRPHVVGELAPKAAHIALLIVSIASLAGLFYIIYNDIGIAKGVKNLWLVQGK